MVDECGYSEEQDAQFVNLMSFAMQKLKVAREAKERGNLEEAATALHASEDFFRQAIRCAHPVIQMELGTNVKEG
jgi:hypothetical protein